MTKEKKEEKQKEAIAKIKEILAKDPRFKDVKLDVAFKPKSIGTLNKIFLRG